jgi:hypothetical protein
MTKAVSVELPSAKVIVSGPPASVVDTGTPDVIPRYWQFSRNLATDYVEHICRVEGLLAPAGSRK